jgi:hypothetical protein
MKTKQHYFSLQPVKPEPTYRDLIKACVYVCSVFFLAVILLAGCDLIDQLLLWLK